MAPHQDRAARRRIAAMEARSRLRADQAARRRRDNRIGAAAVTLAAGAAVVLQLTLFAANPTADQARSVAEGLADPVPTAGRELRNIGNIPDPAGAAGRTLSGSLITDRGTIGVELDGSAAPQAAAVFKQLADEGYYSGRNCHRLTTAASMGVLQCGSANGAGAGDPNFQWGPVENAPADGAYPAGTVAVARGSSTYSNGTQLFFRLQGQHHRPLDRWLHHSR
jgi:peptidyl-prolyl cis-trans isomerase B (cyclophilin B)